jgi:hypothetical protein
LNLDCGQPDHPSQCFCHWGHELTLQSSYTINDNYDQVIASTSSNITKLQTVKTAGSIWQRRLNAKRKQLELLYLCMSETKGAFLLNAPSQRLDVVPLWQRRLDSRKKELDQLYDYMSRWDIKTISQDIQQPQTEALFAPIQIDSPSNEIEEYLKFSNAGLSTTINNPQPEDENIYFKTMSESDAESLGLFSVGLLMAKVHPHSTQEEHNDIPSTKGKERSKTDHSDLTYSQQSIRRDSTLSQDTIFEDKNEPHPSGQSSKHKDRNIIEEDNSGKHLCPHAGCGKVFARQFHLRRHILTHENNKPFKCPHKGCHARFTRSDNCAQHQRTKHGFRM